MKLYDLVDRRDQNIKIYGLMAEARPVVIIFGHIDGMYSYCWIEGEPDKIIHLSASTPLVPYKDGYKVTDEQD